MILARPKSFQHADNIAVVLSALVKTGYEVHMKERLLEARGLNQESLASLKGMHVTEALEALCLLYYTLDYTQKRVVYSETSNFTQVFHYFS